MSTLEQRIQDEYASVLSRSRENAGQFPQYLVSLSDQHASGLWREYLNIVRSCGLEFSNRVVVDFGCKYGHLAPLMVCMGCGEFVGIDAEDSYVQAGQKLFGSMYGNVRICSSELGYLPLQPESVDIIVMNEVISHVNPSYLDTVWREAARVLRLGGALFISDGNNIANGRVRAVLPELYEKWESGPRGVRTDRDEVLDPFVDLREEAIRRWYPHLSSSQSRELAANTSGPFGDYLREVVRRYVASGALVRRPYRWGSCPVNPSQSGAVMERGFHPLQLELALAEYGFDARQLLSRAWIGRPGVVGMLKDVVVAMRRIVGRKLRPDGHRGETEGFQILAMRAR